ncbi:MAG: DUF3604 domain-containing protein [Verrucomicrobiota bacterium]
MKTGKASIDIKKPVEAGSLQTVCYTFAAGHVIDDSGYVKLAFRYAGDFGTPQFDSPKEPNYCSVSTNGDCRVEPRWDPKGNTRPWGKSLYLKVRGGFLDKGETITVVFGDTSKGSPGWQMQTFVEKTFEFKTLVDPFATYEFKELPKSPEMKVVPGKPVRAVCIAPSQVVEGEKITCYLRLEDKWGNATGKAQKRVRAGFKKTGIQTVAFSDAATGLGARSNPIEVVSEASGFSRWWADFHGQSEETIGSNSIEDYFNYARDCAKIDILGHQGNDFQVTDEFWGKINRTTKAFYKPGEFVTFPGYEWSGNTPLGGDRNVYFKKEGGEITRSSHDLLPGKTSKYIMSPTAAEMFENLNGPDPFVFAHVGGRYADVSMHKEGVEVAMEIHSAWGTFEWLVEDALEQGYRIGICANSDGHKTRPGASYPGAARFGSLGGLTCVLAKKLDRNHIHAAMKNRHFYATTGNRPLLDVSVATSDGREAIMGDVLELNDGKAILRVRATGTAPIVNVEVRNGLDVVKTLQPFSEEDLGSRLMVTWSGAEVKGRDRLVEWDGELKLRGNKIRKVAPVNFWNPQQPMERVGKTGLCWKSITTGGLAGAVIELDRPAAGTLEIDTLQKKCSCNLKALGLKPKVFKAGGLRKQIEVRRLPDRKRASSEFEFELPLSRLREGDNPVYVRVLQEDGHMAWSSPVYIAKNKING